MTIIHYITKKDLQELLYRGVPFAYIQAIAQPNKKTGKIIPIRITIPDDSSVKSRKEILAD